ncbi:phosphodiester glycosidase family protein, partial [Clostridioides difficile]
MMKIDEKPTRKDPHKRPISPAKRRWLIITLVIVLAVGGI